MPVRPATRDMSCMTRAIPTIPDSELILRIAEVIREAVREDPSLPGKVKYVYPSGDIITVDGSKRPPEVSSRDEEAGCTIYFSPEIHWALLAAPELQHLEPFRQGKVRIVGDLALAMQIGKIMRENRLKVLGMSGHQD